MRVAELLGSLSLATDLADGFALEKSLRTTALACRLARVTGADDAGVRAAFWATLLRFAGCTAFAHEEGRYYGAGEDIALRRALAMVDFGRPATFVSAALRDIATHAPFVARATALGRLVAPGAVARHSHAQCEGGRSFALAVGMPEVAEVLALRGERWDGKGPLSAPGGRALPAAARLADVADVAELFAWNLGPDEALAELRRRRGGELDPALVDAFAGHAGELWEALFSPSVWETFLASEPAPHLAAEGSDVTRYLRAFSRFADLASVFTLGHSERVAELAERAAQVASLPDPGLARDAGLVHDLGRVAVANGVWEKPGPLTPYERERVRSHSQQTETILRLAPGLATLADVAAATHERGAGAGYHRRLGLESVPAAARVLAAADVFVALRSRRPHREAFAEEEARREMLSMAREGALDRAATDAVLEASGQPRGRASTWPRGLTDREVEVIRLVAVGRTNREVGALLGMSHRTAQKHVMNVYEKLGLESRAGLALFAMEHRLMDA
jgi:HD-GYP domain-containing protein (c-di-GMP phosphodiesterase class II)